MKVYVDDILMKSIEADRYITDLEEAFDELCRYQMKLNPNKYIFEVTLRKFLIFLVIWRGIEANIQKIRALFEMKHPSSVKKVQQLTEKVVSLNWFISRSAKKYLPFFKILRYIKDFTWSDECRAIFDDLKKYIGSAPLLSKSM